jgi:UDP-glucuronate decarboxylase
MIVAAKPLLVAGGAGFLGSHLCERLLGRNGPVLCVDNLQTGDLANIAHLRADPHFELRRADISETLQIGAVRGIFNLACPASPVHYQADPVRTTLTSVRGTHQLLEIAKRDGVRLLQASTSEVYGDPAVHPQTESYWGHVNPTGTRACYDEGKRCAESLCFDYSRQYGLDVRVARIFNTYGPRMQAGDGRVITNFIVQALQNQPITVYGTGSQTRSFCYVDDLIAALVAFMDAPPGVPSPINLGNPQEFTILELAELVIELTGSRSRLIFMPLPSDDPTQRCPNIERAREHLHWEPKVALREGLRRTIQYLESVLQQPRRRLRRSAARTGQPVAQVQSSEPVQRPLEAVHVRR